MSRWNSHIADRPVTAAENGWEGIIRLETVVRMSHDRSRGGRRRGGRSESVRPTSGRVRDALFNMLAERLAGASVLDLYAGTGALGLESLRRGAASAVFVERDPRLAEGIRRDLVGAGLREAAEVWQRDALSAIDALAASSRRFDLIMLDPPYGLGLVDRTLRRLAERDLLAPGGVIAAEGHWRDAPERVAGLVMIREARYGETALWLFQREKETA